MKTWRSKLTKDEVLQLVQLDRQIKIQSAAVRGLKGEKELEIELLSTLTFLRYQRYLLQNRATVRLKRGTPPRDVKHSSRSLRIATGWSKLQRSRNS